MYFLPVFRHQSDSYPVLRTLIIYMSNFLNDKVFTNVRQTSRYRDSPVFGSQIVMTKDNHPTQPIAAGNIIVFDHEK